MIHLRSLALDLENAVISLLATRDAGLKMSVI